MSINDIPYSRAHWKFPQFLHYIIQASKHLSKFVTKYSRMHDYFMWTMLHPDYNDASYDTVIITSGYKGDMIGFMNEVHTDSSDHLKASQQRKISKDLMDVKLKHYESWQ